MSFFLRDREVQQYACDSRLIMTHGHFLVNHQFTHKLYSDTPSVIHLNHGATKCSQMVTVFSIKELQMADDNSLV